MLMMMMMMMIQLMTLGIALLWALPRVHPNLHPTAWAEMTLSSAQNIFYTCKHKIPQFIESGRWVVVKEGEIYSAGTSKNDVLFVHATERVPILHFLEEVDAKFLWFHVIIRLTAHLPLPAPKK